MNTDNFFINVTNVVVFILKTLTLSCIFVGFYPKHEYYYQLFDYNINKTRIYYKLLFSLLFLLFERKIVLSSL